MPCHYLTYALALAYICIAIRIEPAVLALTNMKMYASIKAAKHLNSGAIEQFLYINPDLLVFFTF